MRPKYQIRFAIPTDAAGIAAIYHPFVEESAVSFEEVAPDAPEMEQRIEKTFEKHAWLVCDHGGTIAGYAYSGPFRERRAYRWMTEASVYIHPSHYRRSIATALYVALHDIMKAQGYVKSFAGMTMPNEGSKRFHESFGYKAFVIYHHVGYKFGNWHSTEWFSLQLRPAGENPREIIPVKELDEGFLQEVFNAGGKLIRESPV